ncbi:MAG: response regulator [Acidobacteria bacterium]|nr:response regulator [Acidobacteriota bacterium]
MTGLSRILIVDDEQSMREMLSYALDNEGWEVLTAADGAAAAVALQTEPVDVVVSDIRMPGMDGLELLRHVTDSAPQTSVILMTAHASTDTAIEALRLGAYDYVTKPFDVDELKISVRRALDEQALRRDNQLLRQELADRNSFGNLVGGSDAMHRVFELIRRVTDSTSTVLVIGESGTGKELVARAIHYNGSRAAAPFVAVNCAALPAHLLESELFGHVKGAFTGADRHKEGLFEAAAGGTILLDEIGDMPLEMQPKLLRVLEDRKVRRVGSTSDVDIEVRVLASTNKNLRAGVESGKFREDLFYRLNVIQVDLPPLRDRLEDVALLAEHFLERLRTETDVGVQGFESQAIASLEAHDWPGNVRELANAVRHAVTMDPGEWISVASLPPTVVGAEGAASAGLVRDAVDASGRSGPDSPHGPLDNLDLEAHLDGVKRDYMLRALEQSDGVQTRAAEVLGMSFRSFRYYAKKFGLGDGADG